MKLQDFLGPQYIESSGLTAEDFTRYLVTGTKSDDDNKGAILSIS